MYNAITVIRGRGANSSPAPIAQKAADLFFERTGFAPFSLSVLIKGDVPISRGLGGSVTVRLGILFALNALTGNHLDRFSIFQLCTQLEGHPDNAAPATFGGFTAVRDQTVQRFNVSALLSFVLFIPDFKISTSAARRILPSQIMRVAAVRSCANACAITAAFASGNYRDLRGAFVDHLHQPYRQNLIPFLPRVITAAEKAGALGAFLSGSGSTICAITLQNHDRIATAMKRAAAPTSSRTIITTADNRGARLIRSPITNP
jgi:homoserine kinase